MNQVKTISKIVGSLAAIAVFFSVFTSTVFAEIDLQRVNFVRIGAGDINITTSDKYHESWVKFTLDGSDVSSQVYSMGVDIRAHVSYNGSTIASNLHSASAVEGAINNNLKAGHYEIKYSADDKGQVKNFADRERDVWVEKSSGGGGGSNDPWKWDVGSWGTCYNGIQTRDVVCEDYYDNVLPDYSCVNAGLGSKPATSRTCDSPNPDTYHWYTGSWGTCNYGIQYRTVECRDQDNDYAPSYKCSGSKPATSKSCDPETDYHWYTGPWGTCNYGVQYREVECRDDFGDEVSSYKCSGTKPSTSKTCDDPNNDDLEIQTISATNIDEDSATLRGRVEEGDNISVWFAFSEHDSSPSCSSSSDKISVYGSFDEGDLFSRSVYGLDEDEVYYFRACGENNYGDEDEGYIEDFETDGDNNNDDDLEVVCRISDTSVDDGDRITVEVDIDGGDSPYDIEWDGDIYEFDGFDDNDEEQYVRIDTNQDRIYLDVTVEDDRGDRDSDSCPVIRVDDDDNDDGDIETRSATSVDEDSATLRGRVEEGDNMEVWFVLSRTDSTPSCTSGDKYRLSGEYDEGESFSRRVSGLREDERYYFRACGEDRYGDDVSGRVEDFRTDDNGNFEGDEPEAITYAPTNIQSNYAQLNGFYDANGEDTTVYFEWGRTAALGSTTVTQFKGDTTGSMTHGFTNLSPNTVYCYRAVATNSEGTDRGDTRCFSTNGGVTPPVSTVNIDTLDDPELRGDEATLVGEVVRGTNINTWFALDDSSSVSCRDSSDRTSYTGDYDSGDRFYDTVDGLERGRMYYFRACGSNSAGTIYSGELRDFIAGGDGYGYGYGLSFIRLDIENGRESVTRGDSVEYNVEWENISEDDLFDLTLHVKIPREIVVTGSSAGRYNEEENSITMNISSLREGDRGSMQIYGTVGGGLDEGEAIVAEATMSFDNPINDAKENAIDYDDDIYTVYNPFGAAAFTLGSITFWGWLLALLLLILIILVARWIYLEGKNRENEKNREVIKNGNGNGNGGSKIGTQPEPVFEQPTSNYVPYRPNR